MEHEERLKAALEDRYVIERELGEGGMATVYLAQDLKHDRAVGLRPLKRPGRIERSCGCRLCGVLTPSVRSPVVFRLSLHGGEDGS